MHFQHARRPRAGVDTRGEDRLHAVLPHPGAAALLQRNAGAFVARRQPHAVFEHRHQRATLFLLHHEARAQRAHRALRGLHDKRPQRIGCDLRNQRARAQPHQPLRGTEIQVGRRASIEQQVAAVFQREATAFARARAQVARPGHERRAPVEPDPAAGGREQRHGGAPQQRAAARAVVAGRAQRTHAGRRMAAGLQLAQCGRDPLVQPLLQVGPGGGMRGGGVEPLCKGLLVAVAAVARVEPHQPVDGLLGDRIQRQRVGVCGHLRPPAAQGRCTDARWPASRTARPT